MFSVTINDLAALIKTRDILAKHGCPAVSAAVTEFLGMCVLDVGEPEPGGKHSVEQMGLAMINESLRHLAESLMTPEAVALQHANQEAFRAGPRVDWAGWPAQ